MELRSANCRPAWHVRLGYPTSHGPLVARDKSNRPYPFQRMRERKKVYMSNKSKNWATATVAAGFMMLCVTPGASAQDNRPPTPVTVVNTTLPVSIQGSSAVTAGQSGTWNVGVNNTVSAPVLTRDVDTTNRFTKQLCEDDASATCSAAVNSPFFQVPGSFVVPSTTAAGKTVKLLVIDFVSAVCSGTGRRSEIALLASSGSANASIATGDNFSQNAFHFPGTESSTPLRRLRRKPWLNPA